MKNHVLVAYASRAGSTAAVAQVVGQIIRDSGLRVEVRSVKEDVDPGHFDAVVLGTAIWIGKPLPEATQFLIRHGDALGRIPISYFILCDKLAVDTAENRATARGYVTSLEELKQPMSVGVFAGARDFSTLNPILRWFVKHVIHLAEGDWRSWDLIRAWSNQLARALARLPEDGPVQARVVPRRQDPCPTNQNQ
jgi:menaquinone-dependent protoporphyrinogen oxidase